MAVRRVRDVNFTVTLTNAVLGHRLIRNHHHPSTISIILMWFAAID